MIDVQLLRKEPDRVKQGIAAKNADPGLVDKFLALDEEWRKATAEADVLRAEQKKLSAKVAAPAGGEPRPVDAGREAAKKKKEEIKAAEAQAAKAEEERLVVWRMIPNPPLPEVPVGKTDADNKVVREVGEKPQLAAPKDYLALVGPLGFIDMERAAKVSGSRFGYLMGDLVQLEFALVQLAMRTVTDRSVLTDIIKKNNLNVSDAPFVPVVPPVLISKESMAAMGYLDRGADEVYRLPADDMYLVGTSEQSIGPMHKDEVFEAKDLPKRYLGFSTCFRREAGSYGKDTKGILRVHQFDKAEMFSFVPPEASRDEHKLLLGIEEHLMQALKLPYHVLDICSADLGDPAAAKWDIETWMPGQNGGKGEYRETHSTSNCTDYQARRLNIKYRTKDGLAYVHTLNGTAFAIGRTLIGIVENYQTAEGKVRVPDVLQSYVGTDVIG